MFKTNALLSISCGIIFALTSLFLAAPQEIWAFVGEDLIKENHYQVLQNFNQEEDERGTSLSIVVGPESEKLKYYAKCVDRGLDRPYDSEPGIEVIKKFGKTTGFVPTITTFETSEAFCQIMKKADGGDLSDWIAAKGYRNKAVAKSYFRQLLTAVNVLHSHGFCHRDIKAENILVSGEEVWLTDFEFVSRYSPTTTGAQGSPLYAAPELLTQGYQYDCYKSDVWSLGILFYNVYTGRQPYKTRYFHPKLDVVKLFRSIRGMPTEAPENYQERFEGDAQAFELFKSIIFAKTPGERPSVEQLLDHPFLSSQN